jgi:ElaB/YqjD/DUF883 family membrane-anchored ribosome-binding protein
MTTVKNKHKNHHYDLYDDVEKIKASLLEATQDVKGKAAEILTDSYEEMKERTTEAKDIFANYTAEKPFKSVGIALIIGFTIGWWFRK